MSLYLRIVLVTMAVVANIYAVKKIRNSQMKIENAIFWFFLALLILVLSIFPDIAVFVADLLGVQSTVNFVYLVMIFLLFAKTFSLSIKNAQLEHKTNILTEEIAILKNEEDKKVSDE